MVLSLINTVAITLLFFLTLKKLDSLLVLFLNFSLSSNYYKQVKAKIITSEKGEFFFLFF